MRSTDASNPIFYLRRHSNNKKEEIEFFFL